MKLLLSPHFDDETLFAAFVCLRERPLVLFCFDGAARHGCRRIRERESAAATRLLGCGYRALGAMPELLGAELSEFDAEHVWAPLPEQGGNSDHNLVGETAAKLWPGRVTFYATYTDAGRTRIGDPIKPEPGWKTVKLRAMSCYRSQYRLAGMRPHFERGLEEYEIRTVGRTCHTLGVTDPPVERTVR